MNTRVIEVIYFLTLWNLVLIDAHFPCWSRKGNFNDNSFRSSYFGTSVTNKTNWVSSPAQCQYSVSMDGVIIDHFGNIYFGDCNGYLNKITLTIAPNPPVSIWSYPLQEQFGPIAAINADETVVYVPTSSSSSTTIWAINITQSKPHTIWKSILPAVDSFYSSPVIGMEETQLIFTNSGKITSIYTKNGSVWWSYEIPVGYINSSPSIDAYGTIYVGTSGQVLLALNYDGTLKWEYSCHGAVLSDPSLDSMGNIYFTSFDGQLRSLFNNGTLRWSRDISSITSLNGDFAGEAVGIFIDQLIFGTYGGYVASVNSTTGNTLWATHLGDLPFSKGMAIDAKGRTYIAAQSSNEIFVVNKQGVVKLTYSKSGLNLASSYPAINIDGSIIISNGIDTILSFGNHPGQNLQEAPTYQPIMIPSASPTHQPASIPTASPTLRPSYDINMYCSQVVNGINLDNYNSDVVYEQTFSEAIAAILMNSSTITIKVLSVSSNAITIPSSQYLINDAILVNYLVTINPSYVNYANLSLQLSNGVASGSFNTELYYFGVINKASQFEFCQSNTVSVSESQTESTPSSSPSKIYTSTTGFIILVVVVVVVVLSLVVMIVVYRNAITHLMTPSANQTTKFEMVSNHPLQELESPSKAINLGAIVSSPGKNQIYKLGDEEVSEGDHYLNDDEVDVDLHYTIHMGSPTVVESQSGIGHNPMFAKSLDDNKPMIRMVDLSSRSSSFSNFTEG